MAPTLPAKVFWRHQGRDPPLQVPRVGLNTRLPPILALHLRGCHPLRRDSAEAGISHSPLAQNATRLSGTPPVPKAGTAWPLKIIPSHGLGTSTNTDTLGTKKIKGVRIDEDARFTPRRQQPSHRRPWAWSSLLRRLERVSPTGLCDVAVLWLGSSNSARLQFGVRLCWGPSFSSTPPSSNEVQIGISCCIETCLRSS